VKSTNETEWVLETADENKPEQEELAEEMCLRCEESPRMIGSLFCDYCTQIWDNCD
jgi:hypothetical protein